MKGWGLASVPQLASMDELWMESAFLHPSSLPLDSGMYDLSCSSLGYPAIQRSALDKTPNTSLQAPLPAPLCTDTSSFHGNESNSRGRETECPLQNSAKRKPEDFKSTLRYIKKKKKSTPVTCRLYKGSTLSLRHPSRRHCKVQVQLYSLFHLLFAKVFFKMHLARATLIISLYCSLRFSSLWRRLNFSA